MTRALEGKLALVTGASRGIGAAIAEALGAQGAHVVLVARTSGGLEDVEARIHAAGGSATIAPLDLTDGDSIAKLGHAISGRWSALDVLVLNAAMLGTLTPVPHIAPKEFAALLTLNVTAQQALIAAFDPLLRASEDARIIGITSSVGRMPRAYWGAYGASKAAFETLLGAYAEEMRQIGRVKLAIVDPGATATKMRAQAYPGEDPTTLKQPSAVAQVVLRLATAAYETGHRERVD